MFNDECHLCVLRVSVVNSKRSYCVALLLLLSTRYRQIRFETPNG